MTPKKNGVNLLSFVGGSINSKCLHEIPRNIVYEYAHKGNVDGIILLTGSIGHFCGLDELNTFVEKYLPLPVISISQQLDKAYSIIVDNTAGLKYLINHLIRDHGYRKIGFIKGPDANQEAGIRLKIYKETLEANGIRYDENYIAEGNLIVDSGTEAVKTLLDTKQSKPEVIVAANDDMAIGAMKELHRRGIAIPGDIAVNGFDDQPISNFTMPTLTTVGQNLYRQGQYAVEMILDILNGKQVPRVITLPTVAVIRESCGCLHEPRSNNPLQINGKQKTPAVNRE